MLTLDFNEDQNYFRLKGNIGEKDNQLGNIEENILKIIRKILKKSERKNLKIKTEVEDLLKRQASQRLLMKKQCFCQSVQYVIAQNQDLTKRDQWIAEPIRSQNQNSLEQDTINA